MSYPIRCRICHKETCKETCHECFNRARGIPKPALTETAAAYCKQCKKPTMHRYNQSDLVCNECHHIAVTFHESVSISRDADKQPEPKCKTCNDTGTIPIKAGDEFGQHLDYMYCPDCDNTGIQEKPGDDICFACQQGRKTSKDTEPVIVRDHLIETLRSAPVEITFNEAGYRQTSIGKACHDAAARIEALELELKAAQANQCDGRGSVEFQGILASNGQPVTLCRKCNRWKASPCA